MSAALILWSHALAGLMFTAVALWATRRSGCTLPRWPLVLALVLAGVWALSVAGLGGADPGTQIAAALRNLASLGFLLALGSARDSAVPRGTGPIYGVVALVVVAQALLSLAAATLPPTRIAADLATGAALLRMMIDVAALLLAHGAYAGHRRGDVRLLAGGFGLLWLSDLALTTGAYLTGDWLSPLLTVRGVTAAATALLAAAALQRDDRRPLAVSRTVALQSMSFLAIGGYFALLAVVTSALSALGGSHARLLQTAFVVGSAAAVLTLMSSPWLRSWAKVKVAKHLFTHRYDYRTEWLRFTGTLGAPGQDMGLEERVVKAVADLTESPAGLLLVRDGPALGAASGWHWEGAAGPASAGFVAQLEASERIVELDALRRSSGDVDGAATVPDWLRAEPSAWAVVPLLHLGTLVGAIVLARPALDRALDWEDFDLLRIAGRQVASYLAEARAQDSLAQNQRFDEFNRRFAFIVHDIKNLASGIKLVARNAERHADNPAFRDDMVATLQDSAAKMNALLARLSANHRARAAVPVPTAILPVLDRLAAARRATHPIQVEGRGDVLAHTDAARLEQVIGHLLLNAIEASAADSPVLLSVTEADDSCVVTVADRGCGMSPAFVRDELFRPFHSSKPGGFGIGAFEARQLAEGMGARIEVESALKLGTTFRLLLPRAAAPAMDQAA
ncbi:multi-sensor signal transduction histidine kinase [Sphingomonas guangdongensis]|uniref:histidine kinase n=1 Tax=Sphingomonas guangdongensis TaxID=1141890 RepID=A0A285QBI3_9SPHN|nr:XrtA/PEP-CTERM system histidine kinase PrsK [Sphingomonas guangdongensis]SOB79253.1 multi-sensor signal transduction histidine kinase [Sphingomonas guangdongensis]